jgi:uncharacterized membrane protein YsdA (DUF1294 family)
VNRNAKGTNWLLVAAGGFLIALVAAAWWQRVPTVVAAIYVAVSGIAFVSYALDKSAARRGRWRTPEATLHLLALAGGWPGALAAQTLLRHKTRKLSFQVVFWATVLINAGLLAWLLTRWNVGSP